MKRVLFLFFIASLAAMPALAQEQPVFQPLSYVGLFGASTYLYPEAAYQYNPSVLTSLTRPILQPRIAFSSSSSSSTQTRNDPTQDTYGGTQVQNSIPYQPSLSLVYFAPINAMVVGGGGSYAFAGTQSELIKKNFNFVGEDNTAARMIQNHSYSGLGFYASKIGEISYGAFAQYIGQFSPGISQFTWTTDRYNAPLPPYANSAVYSDSVVNQLNPAIGIRLPLGPFNAGLGMTGNYRISDSSSMFISVDKDGDSYREAVVPYSEYALTSEPWGAGYGAFDYLYRTTSYSVAVYPSAAYEVSPGFTLFADGSWYPIDRQVTETHLRTAANDLSNVVSGYDYGLGEFMGIVGVKFQPASGWKLRTGAGYGLTERRRSYSSLSADGTELNDGGSARNPLNVNNYPEITAAAGQPDNGQVASGTPWIVDTHTVPLYLAAEWYPASTVMLFSSGSVQAQFTTNRYFAFETTSERVWEERTSSINPSLSASFITGVSIATGKNSTLSIAMNALTLSSNLTASKDDLPKDSGAVTESSTVTTTDNTSWNINVAITFTMHL